MAFPTCQKQQEKPGEELLGSWRTCSKINTNTRHMSAPPQCQALRAATGRQPWIFHQRRRHGGRPATPRHRDPAAHPAACAPPSTGTAAATTPARADGGAEGPLSFPGPKFSAAVKVVQGASFILASQTTGRRWMVVSSSRKCQFGEVLRAVELIEGAATEPSLYFAIKVCSMHTEIQ